MARLIRNVGMVLLPFAFLIGMEVLVLPIDYFCVRSAEALIVYTMQRCVT